MSKQKHSHQRHSRNRRHHNNKPRQQQAAYLPSAELLQEYEYAAEGAAKQILRLAEAEQQHRHEREREFVKSQTKSYRLGQLFGLIILLAVISSGLRLSEQGQPILASVLFAAGFAAVLTATVLSKRKKDRQRRGR